MSLQHQNFKRTKYTCYYTSFVTMSSVCTLPPLLFVTFREMYGLSYTMLGALVLLNFCTQLSVDLIFSFFSKYFNIKQTIRLMPLLTSVGWIVFSLFPLLLPQFAFVGLVAGTILFSMAAGLGEVLLSPLFAALPSDTPDRDMSGFHSLYAYGVVTNVVLSTLFFQIFGTQNWFYLTLFCSALPIISFILFSISPIPDLSLSHNDDQGTPQKKNAGLALCVICIFLGGAAETTMTNWISGYMENALQVPKMWGDLLGMAAFGILLGLGRSAYAKYGKNISAVLLCSMIGATVCYLIAGLSPIPILSVLACVLTGLCTAMLWPGTLILMEEQFPHSSVTAYALMAAGGDFGASVAPQTLGIVVDTVSASNWANRLAAETALSAEQIGLKTGIIASALFPFLGVLLLIYLRRYFKITHKK